MKITKNNIEKEENGLIGQVIEKRFGQSNLINQVKKEGVNISVQDNESQGATAFTIDEFIEAYKGRNLIWL